PLPALSIDSRGFGAGSLDVESRANVVQVVVGEATESPMSAGQPARLFEANVDDVTGEVIAHTIAALLNAGAFDAWATAITMKKGRPAFTVHALCDPAIGDEIARVLVQETGTLGIRGSMVERWPQRRAESVVVIDGHEIRVKVASGRVKVEHDDAVRAAVALGVPLREVLMRAESAAG
ncbi:MAG: nickel insertion protein, partial [Ilumatobacteraceae bacterium]